MSEGRVTGTAADIEIATRCNFQPGDIVFRMGSRELASRIGEPVISDVPTLMLVSTFDAFMAPYFTDAAIERFSQSYRFELPISHITTIVPCGAGLMAQFLADPSQAPDASCIQEIKAAWVLPE